MNMENAPTIFGIESEWEKSFQDIQSEKTRECELRVK